MQKPGKPLWTYRCLAMSGLDRNLYDYYRAYAWQNVAHGITGTGIWTYCAQGTSPWSTNKRAASYNLVFKDPERDQILHSRRYEFYREGLDDWRYILALRDVAAQRGEAAEKRAEALISEAIADIAADLQDTGRCERWRERIAQSILRRD